MKKYRLLPDHQLGFLLEIAFSEKPKPDNKDLAYQTLYLRRDEVKGLSRISTLKDFYQEGVDTPKLFTLKVVLGLTAARKLLEQSKALRDQAEGIRKQETTKEITPRGNTSNNLFILKITRGLEKNALEAEELSKELARSYSKGEEISNSDLIRLSKYEGVTKELYDIVEANSQQLRNLRNFLSNYAKQYAERKLTGQGDLPLASHLASNILAQINSDGFVKQYGSEKVPVTGKAYDQYFCHSLLLIHHEKKINLRSIILKPIITTVGNATRTTWTNVDGNGRWEMQWGAIIDNLQIQIPVRLKDEHKESVNIVIADLESKFAEINEEKDDKEFFTEVAGYGMYLLESKIITELISPLYKDSEEDLKNFKKKSKNFIKEWKIQAKDLIKKAESLGFKDSLQNPLDSPIYRLNSRIEETEPSYFDDSLHHFYNPYRKLLMKFIRAGKTNKLKRTHLEADGETIILHKSYNESLKEWERLKIIRENRVWWAHYQIMRLTHGILGLKDSEKYLNENRVIDEIYRGEFHDIGTGRQRVYLKRESFEKWINKLHHFLISRLNFYETAIKIGKNAEQQITAMASDIKKIQDHYFDVEKEFTEKLTQAKMDIPLEYIDGVKKTFKDLQDSYASLGKLPQVENPMGKPEYVRALKDPKQILLEQILKELRESKISHDQVEPDIQNVQDKIKLKDIPEIWDLVETEETAYITKNGKEIYDFKSNQTDKYKYIKYLWSNHGILKTYQEVYQGALGLNYPPRNKKAWEVNTNIRNYVKRIFKELESEGLHEWKLVINRGLKLLIEL